MKKKCLLLSVIMVLGLSGCGSNVVESSVTVSDDPVIETVESEVETETFIESVEETETLVESEETEEFIEFTVDDDEEMGGARTNLSGLSNEELYAGYVHILDNPKMYVDSFMELDGVMGYADNCHPACTVTDEVTGNSVGIEFYLDDGNYPEYRTPIKVIGKFIEYTGDEGESRYRLQAATWQEL